MFTGFYVNWMFRFIRYCQTISEWLWHFTLPPAMWEQFSFCTSSPTFGILTVFVCFSCSRRCMVTFHHVLDRHIPNGQLHQQYFHVFICHLCICISEVTLCVSQPFLNWIPSLLLNFQSSSYTLVSSLFSGVACKHLLPGCSLFFDPLYIFMEQQFFILKSNLLFFPLRIMLLVSVVRTLCLALLNPEIFFLLLLVNSYNINHFKVYNLVVPSPVCAVTTSTWFQNLCNPQIQLTFKGAHSPSREDCARPFPTNRLWRGLFPECQQRLQQEASPGEESLWLRLPGTVLQVFSITRLN